MTQKLSVPSNPDGFRGEVIGTQSHKWTVGVCPFKDVGSFATLSTMETTQLIECAVASGGVAASVIGSVVYLHKTVLRKIDKDLTRIHDRFDHWANDTMDELRKQTDAIRKNGNGHH